MSLPRYEQYKESGLPWVGRVPSHWLITKTKYVCEFSTGWTPPTGDSSAYEGKNLWATISDLGSKVVQETAKKISDKAARQAGIDLIPPGSLMFSFKLSIGQVSFAGNAMYTNEAIATFRESTRLSLAFAYYAFPLFLIQNAEENIYGAKLLNQELIRGAAFALPPVQEQFAIASFLDRETAKIDALIDEQEKLIALLAEKRQATISHGVTKGVNSSAPMKGSGVVWLGEVPAHWNVVPLKWLLDNVKAGPFGSALTKDMYVSGGYRVYGQEQVIPADFSFGDYYISDEKYAELQQYAVKPGDILISCVGTFGKIAIVPEDVEPGIINPRLIRLRAGALLDSKFLTVVLRSSIVFEQFTMVSRGGTMDTINIGTLNAITLAVPPLKEQNEILAFLSREIAKLDELSSAAGRAIRLLKERRSALIAAAVTGKIDVRNAMSQDSAQRPEAMAA